MALLNPVWFCVVGVEGAFDSARDPSPKFVLSLDDYDMSKGGTTHLNIEKRLTGKVDLVLS